MTHLPRKTSAPASSSARLSEEAALLAHVIQTQDEIAAVEMDPTLVMRLIVERTRDLLSGEGAALEIVDGDESELRYASGSLAGHSGFRFRLAGTLSGQCVTTGETIFCNDTETECQADLELNRRFKIRSMVLVPLPHHGALAGLLKVTSTLPSAFSDHDVWRLKLMTSFMGAALMHAHEAQLKQRLLAERSAAITALQESEQRFRKSCEDAAIGMALVALDGRWIKVNHAICDIVGYTETELLATDFQSITFPDDLNADLVQLNQLRTGEIRTYQMNKRYIHRDGHQVWVQLNVSLVRDIDGKPLYYVSQIQDVTESKRMEDSVRESERAYRTMFELAGAGMANIDLRDGRFITVNQKLCDLLGYTHAELCELTVFDLSLPEDRAASMRRIREMANRCGGSYAFTKRYLRKDGSEIFVAIDATSFVDGNGNPTHVVSMFRDITDQKLAEEAMRVTEQQFRTLAEHAPVAIFQSDLEGNNTFVNARWCRMTGLTAEEARGKGWMNSMHPDDRQGVFDARRRAIMAGREYSAQYRYRRADDQIVWVQGSAAPLHDDEGNITGYLGTATDLSERMRAEWLETDRREVLEMVAKDLSIDDVLKHIVHLLERQVQNSIGAVIRLEHNTLTLEAPGMSKAMAEQIRAAPLPMASEFFHRASGEIDGVGVSQLEVDSFWIGMRSTFATAGLRVAWTVPIASSSATTLGWLTVFCQHNRRPTRSEIDLLLMVCKLATISIEHHQTTQKLAHLVRHDSLTGLPNRLMLNDRLSHAIDLARRSKKSVGLMVLDIDKFKSVNDTLGHHAGDQLLQQFGRRLSALLRKTDTMARVGGDEFVIVLPEMADPAGVSAVAQKLIDSMIEPFHLDGGISHRTSTSIGIAFFPNDAADALQLHQLADLALYKAKTLGRNGYQIFVKSAA